MRIEQLVYFVETVEKGSIGKASETLYVSHQNISKALKQLEEELNLNLLKRTKNGVTLTPVGKPIYDYAKEALYSIDKIKSYAAVPSYKQAINSSITGSITIMATPAFSSLLVSAIKKINLLYPNIKIQCDFMEPAHLQNELLTNNKTADLWFLSLEDNCEAIEQLSSKGSLTLLKIDTLRLLVKKTSPLSNYATISLKKLAEVPLAFYNSDYQITPLYLSLLQKSGFKKNTRQGNYHYFSNSIDVIQDYLYSGIVGTLTTSLTTKRSINMPASQCIMIPLSIKCIIKHFMFLPATARNSELIDIFLTAFNEYYIDSQANS